MNHDDLHGAFDDLARRGADDQADRLRRGDGISTDRVTAVARGLRRRRAAVASVAGFALLSGAAVAGATVLDRPAPPQPAAPTPTWSSTPVPSSTPEPPPTATPTGTVLPVGDASLVLGACGSLLDAATDLPRDDRWTVASRLGDSEVTVGSSLPVSTRLEVDLAPDWAPIGHGNGVYRDSGPEFLVARDGVVVATTDLYGDVDAPLTWYTIAASATSATYEGSLPLASCVDGGALPAGDYALVGTMPVLPLGDDGSVVDEIARDGVDAVAARHAGEWRRAVGDPLPFVVVDGEEPSPPAADAAVDDRAIVPAPACGAPYTPSEGSMLTLSVQPPSSVVAGTVPEVPAALGYAGPGRFRAQVQITAGFWAVRDGVVIGATPVRGGASYAVVDLGAGSHVAVSGDLDLRACAGDHPGEPLEPGTYTVVPAVELSGIELRTTGGTQPLDLNAAEAVTAEPFTLVFD
jgi:hypothetical protein